MDTLAVSICLGLNMRKVTLKKTLIIGLYFGIFQAGMLLIGYLAGSLFASEIEEFDHWIAFALLSFLGIRMIISGLRKKEDDNEETSLHPKKMLPFAIATSIDALAVGVSLAFIGENILPAAVIVGLVTLMLSMIGVRTGNIFGLRFRPFAEIFGGLILIVIGVKILLEHTGSL